jgi:hypothetical protein
MHFGYYLQVVLERKGKSAVWLAKELNVNHKTLQGKLSRGSITAQEIFEISLVLGLDVVEFKNIVGEERAFINYKFHVGDHRNSFGQMYFYKNVKGEELSSFVEYHSVLKEKVASGEITNVRLMVCPQHKYAYYAVNCLNEDKEDFIGKSFTVDQAISKFKSFKAITDDDEISIEDDYRRVLKWVLRQQRKLFTV